MQPVQSLVIPNKHSAFHILIINLIITYNTPECDVTLMEPFWYATVLTKTFTRLWTVWPHPWKAESYPEQFGSFSYAGTRVVDTPCTALQGREVRTRPNLSGWKSGGRPASSWALGSSGRGFVRGRKIHSNRQSHPNAALSKPVHCSTHRTVAWGARMGSWGPRCSWPRPSENHCLRGFLSWLLQSVHSESSK